MNLASVPKGRWMQGFAKQASKEAYNKLVTFFKEIKLWSKILNEPQI
jgi:hypothetical protein